MQLSTSYLPRIDIIRKEFLRHGEGKPRYIVSWSDFMIILLPSALLSLFLWARAASAPKPPAQPKPPAAVKIQPGAASVGAPVAPAVKPPAVSPVKAAAAKAVAAAGAVKPKPAAPGEPAVLSAGAEKITKAQFEEILASLPDQFKAQFASPQGMREFAKQYAEMKSIAQEARLKMAQDPKLRHQWQLQLDQTLTSAFMREMVNNAKVDEASMREYYDQHKGEFETVNGRHILIRFKGSQVQLREGQKDLTDEEALAKANDIRKRLAAGEDFAELAKKESDDVGSGAAGGSLGDFGRGQMVPAFEQAAYALPLNQVSEAVRTQFGYHVIQVRAKKRKTLDEARADIERRQKPEMGRKVIDGIKTRYPVVLDEAYFGKD